jgi:hypothetical protein
LTPSGVGRYGLYGYRLDEFFPGPDALTVDQQRLFAEILSCQRVKAGGVVTLNLAEWFERWREFRKVRPDFLVLRRPRESLNRR